MSGITEGALRSLRLDVGNLIERHEGRERDFTPYAHDPVRFIREVLNETDPGPWEAQVEIAEAVRTRPLVVVRGCNSSGKDWISARLALWWVYARRGLALVTGPTQRQVVEIVMGEVARAFGKAEGLPGELYQAALRLDREEQRGILAFVSSDVSRVTGFHAPRVLAVLTEAQGVEPFAWEGVFSCATGSEDRILAVGNPLAPSGRFFDASRAGSRWKSIRVPAEAHPNLRQRRTVIPGGPTRMWAERIAQEYGRGSATYRSRVGAEFPDQGEESLFRRSWLDRAAERWADPEWADPERAAPVVVAVDPARYGPDRTAVAIRRGPRLEEVRTWGGAGTSETAETVLEIIRGLGEGVGLIVDGVGVGGGVVDALRAAEDPEVWVTEFNAGAKATAAERFANVRAESYWRLRTLLEEDQVALPADGKLADELLAVRWRPTADGRVQIEAKDDLRSRLGRSPDRADAVVMAFSNALPPVPTALWQMNAGFVRPSLWGDATGDPVPPRGAEREPGPMWPADRPFY